MSKLDDFWKMEINLGRLLRVLDEHRDAITIPIQAYCGGNGCVSATLISPGLDGDVLMGYDARFLSAALNRHKGIILDTMRQLAAEELEAAKVAALDEAVETLRHI